MRKISFALTLLLVLLLTASVSNAQLKVQSGTWGADKRTVPSYMLGAGGEVERSLTLSFTFTKPFIAKPEVIVSINTFDGDANINTRYDVKTISVHKAGFTVEVKTWGGSKINMIGGTWMAIGE